MNKTKDMTVGSPTKTIFFFSVPVLLGTLFQQIYNMADTIIVGQFLGEDALACRGGDRKHCISCNWLCFRPYPGLRYFSLTGIWRAPSEGTKEGSWHSALAHSGVFSYPHDSYRFF